jgi:hypothetical protein
MPIDVVICEDCGVAYNADVDECPVCEHRIVSEVRVVDDDAQSEPALLSLLDGGGLDDQHVDWLLGVAILVIGLFAALSVFGVI